VPLHCVKIYNLEIKVRQIEMSSNKPIAVFRSTDYRPPTYATRPRFCDAGLNWLRPA